jgi:hypothetical protein
VAQFKKWGLIVVAALSVLVESETVTTAKMTYGMFYIVLGIIIAAYAFTEANKERKRLLIVCAFLSLFTVLGVQTLIDGNSIYGLILLAIAIAIAIGLKERTAFLNVFSVKNHK